MLRVSVSMNEHTVAGECPRLVGEEVGDAAELLGDGAVAHQRTAHATVARDEERIDKLRKIKIHSHAGGV